MRYHLVVPGLLIAAAPLTAQTAPAGPTEKGSKLIAGSASLTHTQTGGGGNSATSINLSPALLYFVANRVAIGGELGLGYTSFDGGHASSWRVGPAARLYFGPTTSKTLPYLGAAVQLGAFSTSSDSPSSTDSDASLWGLEGLAGLTFMVSRQVGITGELFIQRDESTFDIAQGGEVKATNTQYGVRFGVAAFVF